MGKCSENSNGIDFIDIKTDVDCYRCGVFCFCLMSFLCSISAISLDRDKLEIIIHIVVTCIFLLVTIFIDKIVYALRLPTHHLIVYENEVIYQKGKKRFVYKISEISYQFYPWYFDTLPHLKITSKEEEHYIQITRKQYKLFEQFLEARI